MSAPSSPSSEASEPEPSPEEFESISSRLFGESARIAGRWYKYAPPPSVSTRVLHSTSSQISVERSSATVVRRMH